eukprot:TRINITY_DN1758_c0_g1_i1.p1 TRINITY_DN1758_c0_g1~~TRINITY_DN1758_c0_g1_i1.p1  ORF type:complete len:485 (-),score=89.69 TRINITY_DN1758_c0_g1_i1:30-1484(-)
MQKERLIISDYENYGSFQLDSKTTDEFETDQVELEPIEIEKEQNSRLFTVPINPNMSEKVKQFYEQQNALVEEIENLDKGNYDEEDEEERIGVQLVIYASFLTNVTLTIIKLIVLIQSGSISVLASALDSVLDLFSGAIIFCTNRALSKTNAYKYPAGRQRLEPIGVIVFAAVMFTATLQILVEAVRTLTGGEENQNLDISTSTMILFGVTIISKFLLFIFCNQFENISAQALAQDHRNDVILNTLAACTGVMGFYVLWWIDAVGGIIIGLYIMQNWFRTGFEQLSLVAGKSADPEYLQKITHLAFTHDPRIQAVDTVRAYYISNNYLVEVDIVLSETMSLREAHDIGESLQIKLEKLPEIERAFVHLDFEHEHKPEHDKNEVEESNMVNKFYRKNYVISGTFTRPLPQIIDVIESNGGRVVDTVSDQVDYLIAADPGKSSPKINMAKQLGIEIVDESYIADSIFREEGHRNNHFSPNEFIGYG